MRPPSRSALAASYVGRAGQAGATIIELAVVLVIAGVLVAIATPAMRDFIAGEARTAAINDLNTSLRLASSEAQARRRSVVLCASTDGATCVTGTPDFATGWIVFEDTNLDYSRTATGANPETLVRAEAPDLRGGASIKLASRYTASLSATGRARNVISFNNKGRLRVLPGQRDPQSHFVYCDDAGDSGARALYITFAGRPVLAVDSDGDGKDDYAQQDFACP